MKASIHCREETATCTRSIGRGALALALIGGLCASGVASAQNWATAGKDTANTRNQTAETLISPKTVPNLALKWKFTTPTMGDVTATPSVVDGYVYFPDSHGNVYKLNATTGAQVWAVSVPTITGVPGDYSRTTPAVIGKTIILGSQSGKFPATGIDSRAKVFALSTVDGSVLWKTTVDQTYQSYVTSSAVVVNGTAIVGVASNEELTAAFVPPAFWQWQFRGSALALDVSTGAIKWQTFTVPPGYYGGSIWGSTPAVNLKRNLVYVSTGDNYMAPASVLACLENGGSPATCVDPANYADSIIAMDLTTGAVKWGRRGYPEDIWSVACGLGVPGFVIDNSGAYPGVYGNCADISSGNDPKIVGPDYDFAQGPLLFASDADSDSASDASMVGAGAKSGLFWAFRRKDGKNMWSTQVSPGGVTGGIQWGSATNGSTIFTSASNAGPSRNGGGAGAVPWTLAGGTTTKAGGWAAVDAATGKVLWTTPDPEYVTPPPGQGNGARAEGAVTLANGVMFGCNMNGSMYALSAKTGAVLWHRPADVGIGIYGPLPPPCTAGAAVSNGMVFWGSGDGRGTSVNSSGQPIVIHPYTFYAFGL